MHSEADLPIQSDLEGRPLLVDLEEAVEPDLSRSFCANSDLFIHGVFDTPRDLPDEYYRRTAEFFR